MLPEALFGLVALLLLFDELLEPLLGLENVLDLFSDLSGVLLYGFPTFGLVKLFVFLSVLRLEYGSVFTLFARLFVVLLEGVLLKLLALLLELILLEGAPLFLSEGVTAGFVVLSLGFVLLKSLVFLLLGVKVGLLSLLMTLLLLAGLVTLLLSLAELILSKLLLGLLVLSEGTIAGLVVLALGFLTALLLE